MQLRFSFVLFFIFLSLFFNLKTVHGQQEPWRLEADRLQVDEERNIAEAFGNVHAWRFNDFLFADYARLYMDTNWIYLQGDVRAGFNGDLIQGEEAELDLNNQVGWIRDGEVFMAEDNVYFTGKHLEKTGPHTYTFKQGIMTSCDARPAPWSVKSSRGEVTIDGYARLWHTRFRVRDRSIMYSPFLIAPVKTERQSGFLFPDIAYSSELGMNVNLPYYWVIDDERDMTFYANYYSFRGLMTGVEYRHTPRLHKKGLWRADWLRDRKVHDQGNEPSRFEDDGLFRPNRHRYWLRGKYDGFDPVSGWRYKVDVDYVSDQNYLREFREGQSGYDASRNEFMDKFGRDLEARDSLIRTNILSASRSYERMGLDSRLVYKDNLSYKNDNLPGSEDPTVQRLPEINLDLYRSRLGNTPFELEAANEGVYFWRRFGTTATRLDVHPRVSMPLQGGWGRIIPRFGWRQTGYFVDNFEADPAERDTDNRFQTRGIYDVNIKADSELYRIFELNWNPDREVLTPGDSSWTGIRHTAVPELEYEFIPEKDQDKYPRFDSVDRIRPREDLRYTLRNTFTRRMDTVLESAEKKERVIRTDYRDFLLLNLEQEYDFREARRRAELDVHERRPFSDLLAEVVFNPSRYISLSNKTWYSFYENMITEHEHTLTLIWPDVVRTWFSLDFLEEIDEYKRQVNDRVNIIEFGSEVDFIRNWQFGLLYRRDLEASVDLERRLRATYRHQCYSLDFEIKDTDYDYSYEIRINLLNLGSWGF